MVENCEKKIFKALLENLRCNSRRGSKSGNVSMFIMPKIRVILLM